MAAYAKTIFHFRDGLVAEVETSSPKNKTSQDDFS